MSSATDFHAAVHTIVLSDVHLTEGEPRHRNPLWKRYKRPKHFVDRSFKRFLDHLTSTTDGMIELVLNGDIFDFDSTMAVPDDPPFPVTWIERKRGLATGEVVSRRSRRERSGGAQPRRRGPELRLHVADRRRRARCRPST